MGERGNIGGVGASRFPDGAGERLARARQVAQEFEAFFIAQMMAPMFAGIGSQPPFGGGHAEQIYRSMMIDEMADLTARTGGIGIADHIMAHVLAQQEID